MSAVPLTVLAPTTHQLITDIFALGEVSQLTKDTWKYMCLCFDTPRPSGKEEQIREKLIDCAKTLGLLYKVDAVGNLVITKPAAPGYEDKTAIIFQGHLDMVTSSKGEFDFDTTPIPAKISEDKKWVTSGITTLGGDNGIGVAAGLAAIEQAMLLEKANVRGFPQLQLLCTTEEETTMKGALEADPAIIVVESRAKLAQVCINIDSEEHKRVCISCAGGGEVKLTKVVEIETVDAGDVYAPVQIAFGGLMGGHTGVDIHRGRANAIKGLLQELITPVVAKYGADSVRLFGLNGGNAVNAIPRDCVANALIKTTQFAEIEAELASIVAVLHDKYALCEAEVSNPEVSTKEEALKLWKPTLTVERVTEPAAAYQVIALADQDQLLQFAAEIPHGVIDWSKEVEGFVETSNSFSIVKLTNLNQAGADKTLLYHTFFRSTKDDMLDVTAARLQKMGAERGFAATELFNGFPGWAPRSKENPLFKATERAYEMVFNEDAAQMESYAIHAGLESGCIQRVWPHLVQISVGPTILDAHSFHEKLEISTVEPLCDWLWQIVLNLGEIDAVAFDPFIQL